MGKTSYLTAEQELILKELSHDAFFPSNFYFTGGTALSVAYLHHRFSEDLDFFSEEAFDSNILLEKVSAFAKKHSIEFKTRKIEDVYTYYLQLPNKQPVKVDFNRYPYKRLATGKTYNNFKVDSLIDIATNKLLTITQRDQAKDFVDLYFLLQKFNVWDLMEGLKIKFRIKAEPLFIATDFLKAEEFDVLPRMIKPLTLEKLRKFFIEEAKALGRRTVE